MPCPGCTSCPGTGKQRRPEFTHQSWQSGALGGSFSSAILIRLLRDVDSDKGEGEIVAWVSVGGIANAFTGTADFYAGRIEMPPQYRLLIPALGPANLYPLAFLRYSPVYVASEFPPTMIVHTAADRIIPISQAEELEAQSRSAQHSGRGVLL